MYIRFPVGGLNWRLPKQIPLRHTVNIELPAWSAYAVERSDIRFQDTVVIAGRGPRCFGMVAPGRMKGSAQLVPLDRNEDRFRAAGPLPF